MGGEVEQGLPFPKAYTAFNVAQIDVFPHRDYAKAEPVRDPIERIEQADRFFANTGAARSPDPLRLWLISSSVWFSASKRLQ